jgi:transposase
LTIIGAQVHLAHPLGVKAFAYPRVKNDVRDAADLADLLRMGRLPQAWIAPPQIRDLRELVRHRAKLVAVRSGCKCQVHAVVATCGIPVGDERPVRPGRHPAAGSARPAHRVPGAGQLAAAADQPAGRRDRAVSGMVHARLAGHRGYLAIQAIDGLGPVLAAVLVAEIGDVTRFPGPAQLASWVGLTPRHHESDTHVHRGPITKQGSRLHRLGSHRSGAAHRHPDPAGTGPRPGRRAPRPQHRRGRRRP